MTGCLSLSELAASAGVTADRMRRYLADFEADGIAERVTEDLWRLTPSAAADFGRLLCAIRPEDPVPLTAEDLEDLAPCKPGPAKAAA